MAGDLMGFSITTVCTLDGSVGSMKSKHTTTHTRTAIFMEIAIDMIFILHTVYSVPIPKYI